MGEKKNCISHYSLQHSPVTESYVPTTTNMESIKNPDFSSPNVSLEQLNKSCGSLNLFPVRVIKLRIQRKKLFPCITGMI